MDELCTKCGTAPSKRSQGKGTTSWCQPCAQTYERNRWQNLSESKKRSKWLKTKYGLSYEDYVNLYKQQDGKCAICDIEISIEAKENGHQTACVDHCHDTNLIRGLLCNHCNRALGLMKDNKKNIAKMLEYLNDSPFGSARRTRTP